MPSRKLIWAVVVVAGGVYFLGFSLLEAPARSVLWQLSGAIVTIAATLFFLFDRYLWHLPLVWRVVRRPVLRGTWRGTFQSEYVYPATGTTKDPAEAYLVVTQTYSSLFLRFITAESSAQSVASVLTQESDGSYKIYYVYQNTPPLPVRGTSPIHHGGAILDVRGSPPNLLEGSYWTDRKTQGVLHFNGHSKEAYSDFDSARNGNYAT
jgi:hypothetical protein